MSVLPGTRAASETVGTGRGGRPACGPGPYDRHDMETPSIPHDWFALRDALLAGDDTAAGTLIARSPGLIAKRNEQGRTVLHSLALLDHATGVEWLHAHGASLDVCDNDRQPLLFGLARRGHLDLLQWCIGQGANARIVGPRGESLLDHLSEDADYDAFWGIAELLEA